jgi:1-aminocyclopropane-1-carboxylate deaminase
MALHFVSRTDYHDKNAILKKLDLPDSVYVIPEGGTNRLALRGCCEIIEDCPQKEKIDFWCVPCGTGGTLAGMAVALAPQQKAIGFSVLKGNFLQVEVESLITDFCGQQFENWSVNTDYHFGGYAKFDERLIEFINGFKAKHAIQLDPVYTGKMFFGIFDLIEKGFFPKGSAIMVIHTGGQQGIVGFNRRFGHLLDV